MDLKTRIIQQRFKKQDELKYKNKGINSRAGKAELFDHNYITRLGKGSFKKGCTQLVIEHMMYKHMIENKITEDGIQLKQEIVAKFTENYLSNLRLIDHNLADNHLHNFSSLLFRYFDKGEWIPEKILQKKDKKESAKL